MLGLRPEQWLLPVGRIVCNFDGCDRFRGVLFFTCSYPGVDVVDVHDPSDLTALGDMTGRANGVWNFTTIAIPSRVTVLFKQYAGNTPVRWLAMGDVTIHGAIEVHGELRANALVPGVPAKGGPGGCEGGRGGIRFDASASDIGQAAQLVPAVGFRAPPSRTTRRISVMATTPGYHGVYGNVFLRPLWGGSGGGGGPSSDTWCGGNGGGGGAILTNFLIDFANFET